jgi:hypothetical protein
MLIFQGLFPNQVNGITDQIETITPNDTIKN